MLQVQLWVQSWVQSWAQSWDPILRTEQIEERWCIFGEECNFGAPYNGNKLNYKKNVLFPNHFSKHLPIFHCLASPIFMPFIDNSWQLRLPKQIEKCWKCHSANLRMDFLQYICLYILNQSFDTDQVWTITVKIFLNISKNSNNSRIINQAWKDFLAGKELFWKNYLLWQGRIWQFIFILKF